jgi:hypothetical protein
MAPIETQIRAVAQRRISRAAITIDRGHFCPSGESVGEEVGARFSRRRNHRNSVS